jgi:glycine cleavage system regulatory protein
LAMLRHCLLRSGALLQRTRVPTLSLRVFPTPFLLPFSSSSFFSTRTTKRDRKLRKKQERQALEQDPFADVGEFDALAADEGGFGSAISQEMNMMTNKEIKYRASSAFVPKLVIMTAHGPQKEGSDVMYDVSCALRDSQASVEESRVACLGTDLAATMLLTLPSVVDNQVLLDNFYTALPEFTVTVRDTEHSNAFQTPSRIYSLVMEGPDQPYLLNVVLRAFDRIGGGITVRDMETDSSDAPFSGYKVFSVKCILMVPMNVPLPLLDKTIYALEISTGMDIEIRDIREDEHSDEDSDSETDIEEIDV